MRIKQSHRHWIAALIILGAGAVRLPMEAALTKDLRQASLLPEPMELSTRERIGQTSSAVALGGLRTLVATFLHLQAFTAFTEQRWDDLEKTFNLIVNLAPRTSFYWSSGGWHLAYDAASYYQHDEELPRLRARAAWRTYILKGRSFIERGIRNNPDDPELLKLLGLLLSDPRKVGAFDDPGAAFSDAADAYRAAADTGRVLPFVRNAQVYALARAPGREEEALQLARKQYAEGDHGGPPTLLAVLFTLEMHADPDANALDLALKIYGTAEAAYEALALHWFRTHQYFPMDGVAEALAALELRLLIPLEQSVLNKPQPPRPD